MFWLQAEEVGRVVLRLHRDQPVVVVAVRRAQPVDVAVAHHEVHVAAGRRVRMHRLPVALRPAGDLPGPPGSAIDSRRSPSTRWRPACSRRCRSVRRGARRRRSGRGASSTAPPDRSSRACSTWASMAASGRSRTKSPRQYHCIPCGSSGSNRVWTSGNGISPVQSNSGAGSTSRSGRQGGRTLVGGAVEARDERTRVLAVVLGGERIDHRDRLEPDEAGRAPRVRPAGSRGRPPSPPGRRRCPRTPDPRRPGSPDGPGTGS